MIKTSNPFALDGATVKVLNLTSGEEFVAELSLTRDSHNRLFYVFTLKDGMGSHSFEERLVSNVGRMFWVSYGTI